MKIYHLHRKDDFLALINAIRRILKANKKSTINRYAFVNKFTIFIEYATKITTSMFFVVIACYLPYTFVMYVFYGRMEPITTVFIPGIDETELRGFVLTTIFHLLQFGFGSICIASIDVLLAILLICPLIHSYLIGLNLNQLNKCLDNARTDGIEAKARFRNILLMRQEMDQ